MSTTQKMDAFVAEELAQWAPLLEARMKEQVSRRRIVASGDLLRSLAANGWMVQYNP